MFLIRHLKIDVKKLADDMLAANGFIDIENGTLLKDNAQKPVNHISLSEFECKIDYYRLAGQFYYHFSFFENTNHKEVWRLHAQGKRIKEIAVKIRLSRQMIERIIKRYSKELLKSYWGEEKGLDET